MGFPCNPLPPPCAPLHGGTWGWGCNLATWAALDARAAGAGLWVLVSSRLPGPHLGGGRGHETLAEATEGKLGGVPELVAEVAVPQDAAHVQVDVATWVWGSVRPQHLPSNPH